MEKIRRRVRFFGTVQGVGFRYRTYHSAQAYGVTGWVRNAEDGSVEAEFEGTREDIDRVIETVAQGRYISVDRIVKAEIPLENDRGFRIRDSWY